MAFFPATASAFLSEEYLRMRNGPGYDANNIFSLLSFRYTTRDQGNEKYDSWELRPGLGYAFTEWAYIQMECVLGKYGQKYLNSSKKEKYPSGTSMMLDSVIFDVIFGVANSDKVPVGLGIDFFYRCPTERSADMIGREHSGGFALIISESYGAGHNSSINLSYERNGDKDIFQWAVGSAFQVAKSGMAAFKIGLEFIGDYTGHSAMIPGVYAIIDKSFSVKTGVFIGLSQYTEDHDHDGNKEDDLSFDFAIVKKW
jgi:hypothetical protein